MVKKSNGRANLVGHICKKCNVIVAYRVSCEEVYCSNCNELAVPDVNFKPPGKNEILTNMNVATF